MGLSDIMKYDGDEQEAILKQIVQAETAAWVDTRKQEKLAAANKRVGKLQKELETVRKEKQLKKQATIDNQQEQVKKSPHQAENSIQF